MRNVGHVWDDHLRALRTAAAFLAAGLRAAGLAAFLAAGLRAALAAGLRADLAGEALFAIEQKKNWWVIVH